MLTLALEQLTTAHLKAIYARRGGREHLERALGEGERARGRLWRQACALTLRGLFERRFAIPALREAMEACLEQEATGGLERLKGSANKERAHQRALDELAEELWGDVQGVSEGGSLGRSYEQLIERPLPSLDQRPQAPQHSEREVSASYYTPEWMVEQALEVSLQRRLDELTAPHELFELSVLDPACGAGFFLLSSLERLWGRLEALKGASLTLIERVEVAQRCLYGVDLSPQALELARLCVLERVVMTSPLAHSPSQDTQTLKTLKALKALSEALKRNLTCADALLGRLDGGSFDVVVGNPPYIDSEAMQRAEPQLRRQLSVRFKSCRGNWDLFVPFVELSLNLLKPQGALALITPRQLISADYAAALQAQLLTFRLTHLIDYVDINAFEGASVNVITLAVRAQASMPEHAVEIWGAQSTPLKAPELSLRRVCPQRALERLPRGHWSALLSPHADVARTLATLERHAPLSSVAQVSDGATTSEAYALKALIDEQGALDQALSEPHLKLINTGTIDPCQLLWGARPLKYLKASWREPVVSERALAALSQRRLTQALTDKVVVAGLSIELEAAVAPSGFLCGKSAKQLIPHEGVCPYALCAYLNSQHARRLYRTLFSARGMGRAISVGSRQLEALPIPPREALSAPESETAEAFPSLSTLGKSLHADPSNEVLLASLEETVSACMGFA